MGDPLPQENPHYVMPNFEGVDLDWTRNNQSSTKVIGRKAHILIRFMAM